MREGAREGSAVPVAVVVAVAGGVDLVHGDAGDAGELLDDRPVDEDAEALATHYHSLLLASLRRHLQLSLPFYANGGTGRWWHGQYAAARDGYERTTALLAKLPEPRFALHGFDLVRRAQAA